MMPCVKREMLKSLGPMVRNALPCALDAPLNLHWGHLGLSPSMVPKRPFGTMLLHGSVTARWNEALKFERAFEFVAVWASGG